MLRINTCCKNRQMFWEDQKRRQHKRGLLKKENKRRINDRTRLFQMYVPSTKDTSHFGIVWNRNTWSVFEPSAIGVNTQKHLAATRVDIPRKRPAGRLSLSSVPPPEIPLPVPELRQWRELESPRPARNWWKKIYIPWNESSVVER